MNPDKCKRCGGSPDLAAFKVDGYENGAPLPAKPSHFLCEDCYDHLQFGEPSSFEWCAYGWDEAFVAYLEAS